MSISRENLQIVLESHCRRVLDKMSQEELYSFALQSMMQSFDQNPGVGDTDIHLLASDIKREEEWDEDSASEFLTGCGLEDSETDYLLSLSLTFEEFCGSCKS